MQNRVMAGFLAFLSSLSFAHERHISFNGRMVRIGVAEAPRLSIERSFGTEFKLMDVACTPPKVTEPGVDCCSYDMLNEEAGTTDRYNNPTHAFSSSTQAKEFLATVRARMPFWEPFQGGAVDAAGGWYYNNGNLHAAMDYVRTDTSEGNDPTFEVRAVAAGRVLAAYWDNWLGNTVIVEHTASNGARYRSIYNHLRNGRNGDVANARAIDTSTIENIPKNANWFKYKKFADKANPKAIYWGTEAHTIQVTVGQQIQARQLIGYSGNTGAGGAGNGLDSDGNPINTVTANNHLHFFMAVPDPVVTGRWVLIDPYGVYGEVDTGCYEVLKDTQYRRLFATFQSSFHGMSSAKLAKYFDYYPGMGFGLQTLSVHKKDKDVLVSGSFQKSVEVPWKARFLMTPAEFSEIFKAYDQQGLVAREISVLPTSDGSYRVNMIWKKRNGEGRYVWAALSDEQFSEKWKELVNEKGYRVVEHFIYALDGKQRHAAIFVNDGVHDFHAPHSYAMADYEQFWKDKNKAGYRQVSFNVGEVPSGKTYSGVFLKVSGSYPTHAGYTSDQYQEVYSDMVKKGYSLYKIQGYGNSSKYATIFRKP